MSDDLRLVHEADPGRGWRRLCRFSSILACASILPIADGVTGIYRILIHREGTAVLDFPDLLAYLLEPAIYLSAPLFLLASSRRLHTSKRHRGITAVLFVLLAWGGIGFAIMRLYRSLPRTRDESNVVLGVGVSMGFLSFSGVCLLLILDWKRGKAVLFWLGLAVGSMAFLGCVGHMGIGIWIASNIGWNTMLGYIVSLPQRHFWRLIALSPVQLIFHVLLLLGWVMWWRAVERYERQRAAGK